MWRKFLAVFLLASAAYAALGDVAPNPLYSKAVVEPVKTSIYVGYVKLTTPMFARTSGGYESIYDASVFPFFFWSEHGRMTIDVTDDDLRRLERGETVQFKGRAENSGGEKRHIDGQAVPLDAAHGKLKVRVYVTKKIQLIFNTTYRFVGERPKN